LGGDRRPWTCSYCAKEHSYNNCPDRTSNAKPCCANCGGEHSSAYRQCPKYTGTKQALAIRAETGCSYRDALTRTMTKATTDCAPPPPPSATKSNNLTSTSTSETTPHHYVNVDQLTKALSPIYTMIDKLMSFMVDLINRCVPNLEEKRLAQHLLSDIYVQTKQTVASQQNDTFTSDTNHSTGENASAKKQSPTTATQPTASTSSNAADSEDTPLMDTASTDTSVSHASTTSTRPPKLKKELKKMAPPPTPNRNVSLQPPKIAHTGTIKKNTASTTNAIPLHGSK
jgi:hypothetical protein